MEWKIGEIKQIKGEWYQAVKGEAEEKCTGCFFKASPICIDLNCLGNERKDHTKVIFKKLEKLGEPFERNGYLYQEYKAHTFPLLMSGDAKIPTANGFAVIIKQNKEDMENQNIIKVDGKKYKFIPTGIDAGCSDYCAFRHAGIKECECIPCIPEERNDGKRGYFVELPLGTEDLNPFDLEAAKAGKPVCTRDGRKARIICFDAKGDFPIVALVETNNIEEVYQYTNNGLFFHLESNDLKRVDDLMMLPEKKVGYVNLYHNCNDKYAAYLGNNIIYKDRAFAENIAKGCLNYIKTVKVEWKE